MPTDLPLRENEDIQGDILAGFKKDQMVLLFLTFEDGIKARSWLRKLTPRIATTRQVAAFNKAYSEARKRSGGEPTGLKATWLGVSFTYKGLETLIGKEPYAPIPKEDDNTLRAFQQGPVDRFKILKDEGDSHPSTWVFGNNRTEESIHAILTIASDTVEDLQAEVIAQREAAAQTRVSIVFQQNGATLPGSRRGKEHFGFKDGVSEPGVQGFDEPDPLRKEWVKDHPGTRLIPAGEFVIGQPRVEPGVLPKTEAAWAHNGSFHVVRRLAQDVPGWWAQLARLLPVLREKKAVPQDATVEWLAARVVGRWRSGTPVAKCPHADTPFNTVASNDNEISYLDDLEGHTTPLFSHLRKTNPRDALQERPGEQPLPEEPWIDRRRIMRRGSPYGQPFDPAAEGPGGPDDPRGLLFVSYQADLVTQFEFIQNMWIDAPNFPPNRKAPTGKSPNPGPDAMVGVDGTVYWEHADGEPVELGFQRFVKTEGTVYAFAPSITVLKALGDGRLPGKDQPELGQPVDTFWPVPDMQRDKGKSWYWVFRTVGGKQVYRLVSIADGDEHTDVKEAPDQPISEWDSFDCLRQVDFLLPFPDRQRVNGKTWYWLFHTPLSGTQQYRVISIADGRDHEDVKERADSLLADWKSLEGVAKVDFVLPVPDRQRVNGKSLYWVFHTTAGQQLYRVISIADGEKHEDALVLADQRISEWDCFANISRITTILPVPDMQRINGISTYWVFHRDQYRIVSIADGSEHQDRIVVPDRGVTLWKSLS
ncbi:Dyp-type peroxidase [Kitasatospora sp. NPDC085879]|uniref:Dyp-type peroxidase n=1 Tax=Kitasatospora sp. NPDC085879 TaxID=3154769 RepID=UPI000BD86579|nr:Dyp-type peroxidase [Streptomyces sp. TLI_235]PBC70019.1 Dyp-type peroxidase family [Streptomyces sp. TLI_235]